MIMVGFGHEKLVGKDTFCKFLCSILRTNTYGKSIMVQSFAYKLKDVCHQLYSWAGLHSPDFYEVEEHKIKKDQPLPKLEKSPRRIWIEMGTLVGRAIYSDTWVDYLFHNTKADIVLVSDMRFPNEANRILHHNGYVFKIIKPDVPHTSDEADDPLLDYASWTDVIMNDKDKPALYAKAEQIAKEYILPKLT